MLVRHWCELIPGDMVVWEFPSITLFDLVICINQSQSRNEWFVATMYRQHRSKGWNVSYRYFRYDDLLEMEVFRH